MAAIREELVLADSFSGTFNQFNTAADSAIATAEAFKSALDGFSEGFLEGLTSELQKANNELNEAGNAANNAAEEQAEVTQETQRTAQAAGNWVSQIKSAVAALGVAKLAKEFIETADEMTLIGAKLDMINDGIFEGAELQEQVFAAAQRSRSAFADTATLITRIGQNASNVFNNAEAIQFAENMNKSFKIAGASQQEIASATLQLSQALASGTLRGEEFNAINESAPSVIQRIADAMGVEKGEMRALAQEGKISAEVIKSAMLGATDEINAQFEQLPMTWSDMITQGKNTIQWALQDIMDQWSEFLNSTEGQEVFNDVVSAIVTFAQIGSEALMAVATAISWVHENWEALEPIINIAAAAAITYGIVNVAAAVASAAAWLAANWPILLVVAALAAGIGMARSMGATMTDVGKTVGMVFGTLYSTVYNIIAAMYNRFAAFAEFLANVFIDPIAAAKNLFYDLLSSCFGVLQSLAGAIDTVFGTSLASAVGAWKTTVSGFKTEIEGGVTIKRMEDLDVQKTAESWGEVGAGLGTKLENLTTSIGSIGAGIASIDASQFNIADSLGGGNGGEVGKVGKVGSIEGDVKLSDEDLQMYRDLAEARYMQKIELKTLAPKINVNVPKSDNLSADDVASAIKVVLIEQMASHTANAHG